jgi:type II secretory pathway component GspD/PulD (secretin)
MKHILVIIVAFLLCAMPVCGETSIKTEVKVATPVIKAGEGQGVVTAPPEKAFTDGQLYYNAIPAGPSPAGTAVKVIDSKDDIDYISRVYEVSTPIIAGEIASYLRTTLDKELGKTDVSVNLETGKRYLVVTAPIFQFPGIEETIRRLDSPGTRFYEDGTKNTAYKMRHRLASEVADLMQRTLISKDGKVYADDNVNMIYYVDSPSYLKGVLHYVEQFDVPVEMVRIDVAMVEIERSRDYNFGVDLSVISETLPENVDMTIDWSAQKGSPGGGPSGWARYIAQRAGRTAERKAE